MIASFFATFFSALGVIAVVAAIFIAIAGWLEPLDIFPSDEDPA